MALIVNVDNLGPEGTDGNGNVVVAVGTDGSLQVGDLPRIIPSDGGPPSGSAGGDLAGTYPNPRVAAITETSGPDKLTIGDIGDGQMVVRVGDELVGQDAPAGGSNLVFAGASFCTEDSNTFGCHLFPPGFPSNSGTDPAEALMPVAGTIKNFRLRYMVDSGGTGMNLYLFKNGNLEQTLPILNGGGSETTFAELSAEVEVSAGDGFRALFSGNCSPDAFAKGTLTFELEPA